MWGFTIPWLPLVWCQVPGPVVLAVNNWFLGFWLGPLWTLPTTGFHFAGAFPLLLMDSVRVQSLEFLLEPGLENALLDDAGNVHVLAPGSPHAFDIHPELDPGRYTLFQHSLKHRLRSISATS